MDNDFERQCITFTKMWPGSHVNKILWRSKDKMVYFLETPSTVQMLFMRDGRVASIRLVDEALMRYFPKRHEF